MVKDYLNSLKNKGNFTAKDIEKMSGIPVATVRKVLSGETDDPRFDTVVKLVSAMGGSLDHLAEKKGKKEIESNSIVTLKEIYDERIKDIKDHTSSLSRDKQILSTVAGVLVAILLALLIFDISISPQGWVRYKNNTDTN